MDQWFNPAAFTPVPSESWLVASIVTPASRARQPPMPSKFSMASPSGSISRWQLAHVGFARCSAIRSFIVRGRGNSPDSLSGGTFGGGGGGGDPSSTSMIHLPRKTGDVRSAIDVSNNTLP